MFGPGCSHNGVILADTDDNMKLNLRRLTCLRELQLPGYHWYLRYCQISFLRQHRKFLASLAELYAPVMMGFTDSVTEAALYYAAPHPKRLLRMQAYEELTEKGIQWCEHHPWMNGSASAKAKRDEYMKPNKYGRCIFDFKTPASLAGFRLCNFIKYAQLDGAVEVNGGLIEFCKSPDPAQLYRMFNLLLEPPGRFYFMFFSDDSCLAVRKDDHVEWYNLDIKSCDASHTGELFAAMRDILPQHCQQAFNVLIKQCSSLIKIRSRSDPKLTVKLQPTDPLLMSGTTLTGAINGLASILICYSISLADVIDGDVIETAAARVGYVVTGCQKPLICFEEVQFLKHSPVRDTRGKWQPMLNLGVLFRASGSCHGELPGRGDITLRAKEFQASLLKGAYPYTTCTVLERMRRATGVAFPSAQLASSLFLYKVDYDPTTFPPYVADDASIYRRYHLTASEIVDLEDTVSNMRVGQWFHGSCVSRILDLDYGLCTVPCEAPSWIGQAALLHDGLYSSPSF